MNLRLSLADKISATIIIVGIFCILLVYYISNSYKQLAYEHHEQAIQQLAELEVIDLIESLKVNALDLALAIDYESAFKRDYRIQDVDDMTLQLNNQFNQYFVTAGILKLLKLYVLDTDFTLLSLSTQGISTETDSPLLCSQLSYVASTRKGAEQLQTLSRKCLYKNKPIFAVIVPFGGLNPKGFIQVVTDLAYSLRKIEESLAMPIQISTVDRQVIYESKNWQMAPRNNNSLNVRLPILNSDNDLMMTITLQSDMSAFNEEMNGHRNRMMSLTFITTGLIVIIVIFILRRSTIPPLANIHSALEKIHLHSNKDSEGSRLLFEQLLDQIIKLRRKSRSQFCVMILDLNQFKQVNVDYGSKVGDQLLLEVELRLSSVLRGSDMVAWVGTDSPGHKLMPTETKTKYRATIARLGGDEFGLLLPSAETPKDANVVAKRIVDALNKPFEINNHKIEIKCKIGISIYPLHGEDENTLIRNADKAMYQARSLGKAAFIFDSKL